MIMNNKIELLEIINELTVANIKESLKFYNNYFNFEIVETTGNPITWAKLKKDNCYIMLERYDEVLYEISNYPKKVSTSNIIKFKYKNKKNVLEIYQKIKNNNIPLLMEIKETEYGTIEFGVYDLDKNIIIISSNNI